jgi:hypothetical protein
MTAGHSRRTAELDATSILVSFSPQLTQAFADLAAAVHFSRDFDPAIFETVKEWGEGKKKTLHGVLISLPSIADETMKHIHATGDERAREAWEEIQLKIAEEKGFSLRNSRRAGVSLG